MSTDPIDWARRAKALDFNTRPLIEGRRVASTSPDRYADINPANEAILMQACAGSAQDVDAAVGSAQRAFRDGRWSNAAPEKRRDALQKVERLLETHGDTLALLDSLEVGKPITQALSEVGMARAYLRFAAESCDKLRDDVVPAPAGSLALNVREPVGVVGAILPWNFPMVVAAMKIAPALACGNSIVLKPSELSPSSALHIGALALEAGIPPGVLNVVPGLGATVGRAMAEHDAIDMLTFTGSTRTGRALLHSAGNSNLKKLLLECGGKSPHIVFADIDDLDVVADDVVEQITWNQGQVCVAGSRLLVQTEIHRELVAKVVERMSGIVPSDPLDPATTFGPLASGEQLAKVSGFIETARNAGADLRVGGRRPARAGFYLEPAVFDHVRSHMPLAREEIFGPVLAVMPFSTEEDALALAHAVSYGLSARIWIRDVAKGYALARRLRVGDVTINAAPSSSPALIPGLAAEPFGLSGFGIEGGFEGIRQYTRLKAIQIHMPGRS